MNVCPAFIDETGVLSSSLKEQPVYGIGLLIVPEPREATDAFYKLHFNFVRERSTLRKQIRKDILDRTSQPSVSELDRLMWSSRHHEYKFTEITRFNLQQYLDLLNLYFSYSEMEFHALLMDRIEPGYKLDSWNNDVWTAYISLAKELARRRLKRDVFVISDLQGKPNRADNYLEDYLCEVPFVQGCFRATSDMSVFLQIVDVLLGCVQFDWKDERRYYGATSKRAEEKRSAVSFVKNRLGLHSGERFFRPNSNFRQWNKPSKFSVWKWKWPAVG